MVFDLLIGTFLGGLGLLLRVLHLMRALYACGVCDVPEFSSTLDESHTYLSEPAYTSRLGHRHSTATQEDPGHEDDQGIRMIAEAPCLASGNPEHTPNFKSGPGSKGPV